MTEPLDPHDLPTAPQSPADLAEARANLRRDSESLTDAEWRAVAERKLSAHSARLDALETEPCRTDGVRLPSASITDARPSFIARSKQPIGVTLAIAAIGALSQVDWASVLTALADAIKG